MNENWLDIPQGECRTDISRRFFAEGERLNYYCNLDINPGPLSVNIHRHYNQILSSLCYPENEGNPSPLGDMCATKDKSQIQLAPTSQIMLNFG